MKQLISLFLIILITAISWSSIAQSKVIKVKTIYTLSYPVLPSSLFTPAILEQQTNDNLSFPQAKVISEHNGFFELSIVFNEKLQQIIAFFTRWDDKEIDVFDNSFPSYTNSKSTNKVCKTNN